MKKAGDVMPIIKPAFHHVTIKTSRLQEMIDWYNLLVGVEVNFQDEYNAWTTNDEANHRIAFLSVPGLEDDADKTRHNGMHHCAFEYADFADLMSSYDRLVKAGVEPAFSLDHGLTTSIYYKDPEGNYVELQCDNFGDWAKSSHYIRSSSDFRASPIGTFFDPARVFAAHAEGRSFAELQPAVRAGAFLPEVIPNIGLPV